MNPAMLWIAGGCHPRDTGRTAASVPRPHGEEPRACGVSSHGTCRRVNDSLRAGTVNEQLPTGEAAGAAGTVALTPT
jgi:hypothetical protein